jgi:lauroyl/myristoyl acyltransferase
MKLRLKPDWFSWRYHVQYPLLARLPLSLGYKAAKYSSQYWRARQLGGLEIVREQMRITFPHATESQIDQWLVEYSRMVEYEALDTWHLNNPKAIQNGVTLRDFEPIEAAKHQGRRVLLTGGHIGRFWLAGSAMAARGFKVGTLTRDNETANSHHLHVAEYQFRCWKLQRLKASLGGTFLVEGNLVRPLYQALDEELITLLFDVPYAQNQRGGVTVSFLNGTIKVPVGIYKIAKKTQALIAPFYMRDLGDGGVIAEFSSLLDPDKYNEEECMNLLASQLSAEITKAPSQWWLWAALPLLRRA